MGQDCLLLFAGGFEGAEAWGVCFGSTLCVPDLHLANQQQKPAAPPELSRGFYLWVILAFSTLPRKEPRIKKPALNPESFFAPN